MSETMDAIEMPSVEFLGSAADVPEEWKAKNAAYVPMLTTVTYVEVRSATQRARYTVGRFKEPGQAVQWWVWYPSGKMWSSYGATRLLAVRGAIASAWASA